MRLLLISATAPELRQTTDWLQSSPPRQKPEIEHLVTGVGQLQTAYCLLKKIYTHRPDLIIQAGIGGSSDEQQIGRLFGIRAERLADLGVQEKSGFSSIFDLKLADPQHFPFSQGHLENPYQRWMDWSGFNFVDGITVNEISTSALRIQAFKQNSPFFVESMEGAALHYVCLMEKIPFLQIRSVSNLIGERDKRRWKLTESVAHLNDSLILLLQKLESIDENILRI